MSQFSCTCGAAEITHSHASDCPARITPAELEEFFPPSGEQSLAETREDVNTALIIGTRALEWAAGKEKEAPTPPTFDVPFDPDAQSKRSLNKADRFKANEVAGLTYDQVNFPSAPEEAETDEEKEQKIKEWIEEQRIMRTYGAHVSQNRAQDTVNLSGVGALDAEAICIVGKVNKKDLFKPGYDVEEEGREFAKATGMVAEKTVETPSGEETTTEVPETKLEDEGIVTTPTTGKTGSLTEWARRWLHK